MRLVFDIETDGLLRQCTRLWILQAHDLDTGEDHQFLDGNRDWIPLFNQASELIGHNIVNFDLMALEKLFGWKPRPTTKITDTLLLSQILNYNRFPSRRHSLEEWGQSLGILKGDYNDWSALTPEMVEYCEQDVRVSVAVWKQLDRERRQLAERAPNLNKYIHAEHQVAEWMARASYEGWPFDAEAAQRLEVTLQEDMKNAEDVLSERLGLVTVATDRAKGEVPTKFPRWTKEGFYNAITAKYFNVDPVSGYEGEERIVEGEYCRVHVRPLLLSSVADVKTFLFRNGWEPTSWNTKRDPITGKDEKTSPKITEDSLELLGGDGKLYSDYCSARSRHAIVSTWLENVDEEGCVHGDSMVVGTPSMRMRHSIIVNVPNVDAPYGKEMRALFTCKPGWKVVGCDSAGNQARGLAHFLKNPEFVHTLLHGDIHQANADVATDVLRQMGVEHVVPRSAAKRILYAFLFGAAGGKLWSYIFGTSDAKRGASFKKGFTNAVPGFSLLLKKLESIYEKTKARGDGYIPSLVGNRIYVDSPHKLLVYLLQSTEKITMSAAVGLVMDRLREAGIEYRPLIMMHDEIQFMVKEEDAEKAKEIANQAFKDGPASVGIDIMEGDAKSGNNWLDTH